MKYGKLDIATFLLLTAFVGWWADNWRRTAQSWAHFEAKRAKLSDKYHEKGKLSEKEELEYEEACVVLSFYYGWKFNREIDEYEFECYLPDSYSPSVLDFNTPRTLAKERQLKQLKKQLKFSVACAKTQQELKGRLTKIPSLQDNNALLGAITNAMSISEGFFTPIFSNPPPFTGQSTLLPIAA